MASKWSGQMPRSLLRGFLRVRFGFSGSGRLAAKHPRGEVAQERFAPPAHGFGADARTLRQCRRGIVGPPVGQKRRRPQRRIGRRLDRCELAAPALESGDVGEDRVAVEKQMRLGTRSNRITHTGQMSAGFSSVTKRRVHRGPTLVGAISRHHSDVTVPQNWVGRKTELPQEL